MEILNIFQFHQFRLFFLSCRKMQQYRLHGPATVAASACGIAFIALILVFPVILNDIAQMEEELSLHRDQYQAMSNTIWNYLMKENYQLRLIRSVRRNRSQQCIRDFSIIFGIYLI